MITRPVILCAIADLSRAAVEQKLLVRAGFAVTYAPTAAEASYLLASRHIDLIIVGQFDAAEQRHLIRAARDHQIPVITMGPATAVVPGKDQVYSITEQSSLVPCIRQALSASAARAA